MMTAEQFGWAALIRNGKIGVNPGYYSGWENTDGSQLNIWDYKELDREFDRRRSDMLEHIKQVGVDWSKSKEPMNDTCSVFAGTFVDSGTKEFLSGTLHLKDGTTYYVMDDEFEPMSVFRMMANVAECEEYFKQNLDY